MSHATMLERVKAELEYVDAEALPAILDFIARFKRESNDLMKSAIASAKSRADEATVSSQPSQFMGENLTPEEYERLSPKERALLQRRRQEQNHHWQKKNFLSWTQHGWWSLIAMFSL